MRPKPRVSVPAPRASFIVSPWTTPTASALGRDDYSRSFVRALDAGGTVWEGEPSYPSLDDALAALDAGIRAAVTEMGPP